MAKMRSSTMKKRSAKKPTAKKRSVIKRSVIKRSDTALAKQMAQNIAETSKLSQAQLMVELGRRLEDLEQETMKASQLKAAKVMAVPKETAALMGPIADKLKSIARRFLDRYNRSLYELICNPSDPDNAVIKTAVQQGTEKLGLVLAGILVASFGWLPGLVTVVVALLLKRFVNVTHSTACEIWKQELA